MDELENINVPNKLQVKFVTDDISTLMYEIEKLFESELPTKDVLRLYAAVKYLQSKAEDLTKSEHIKDIVLSELDRVGEKSMTIDNFTISKRGYAKYDFTDCNHPLIAIQEYINSTMEEAVKDAKDFIKTLSKSTSVVRNDVVAIQKEDVLALKQAVTEGFDSLLDNFEEGQSILTFKVNPASFSGGDTLTVKINKK